MKVLNTDSEAQKSAGFRSINCEAVQETSVDGTDSFQGVSELYLQVFHQDVEDRVGGWMEE